MSSKILYLYDNLLDSATLTASSEATGFPANNLKNPFRTKVWRTEAAVPGVATLVIDHGSAKTVDAIALTGYTWATAPGRLVVEFNDSNSWDTPAAVETLTWHSPTTPGGNKGSIILKLSTARTYRYNRLRVAAQSVTLTAASSGSTGIYTADSDHIDFGTSNFSLVWRCSLPDWTPDPSTYLLYKVSAGSGDGKYYGVLVVADTTGKLRITLYRDDAGSGFTSTVAASIVDGTVHEICISVTRETAGVAGAVVFYVDGVALGSSVPITAAAPVTISNTGIQYIMGYADARFASTSEFFATFNRALSAADVLALYQNGIAYADKWGAQTELITNGSMEADSDWTSYSAPTTNERSSVKAHSGTYSRHVVVGGAFSGVIQDRSATLLANKRYRFSFWYYIVSGGFYGHCGTVGSLPGTAVRYTTTGVWTQVVIEGVMPSSTNGIIRFADMYTGSEFYIDDVSLVEIGATMALEPEGIKTADWQDSSNNNCDGAYPAAGCTVNGAADWDLGRLFVGEYFEPTHNYSWGYEEGIVDPSLISSTIGGQDHADEIEHYRTVMASGVMSAQAQWVDYQVMINTVGVRKPLWIAFDYDSEAEERTIYGKFATLPAISRPYLFNWSFEFKEDR